MNKDFEKWAEKLIEKYKKIMFLDEHIFTVEYCAGNKTSCEINYRYPYLDHTITYKESAVEAWQRSKTEGRRLIIHELCHAITDEMYSKGLERYLGKEEMEEAREHTTDKIAAIICRYL